MHVRGGLTYVFTQVVCSSSMVFKLARVRGWRDYVRARGIMYGDGRPMEAYTSTLQSCVESPNSTSMTRHYIYIYERM